MVPDANRDELHGERQLRSVKPVTSRHRRHCIEGALAGIAVGEAVGLSRCGMSPRGSLWWYGRRGMGARIFPRRRVTSAGFHGTLSLSQAILRSYQDRSRFTAELTERQRWYVLASPLLVGWSTWSTTFWQSLGFSARDRQLPAPWSHLMPGQILLSIVLRANAHGYSWNESAIRSLHRSSELESAARLLFHAARMAMDRKPSHIDLVECWNELQQGVEEPKLSESMARMKPWVEQRISLAQMAEGMGWSQGGARQASAVVLLGLYSWLRHPYKFRQAVEPTFRIGGRVDGLAAIAGGLAGTCLGKQGVPPEWRGSAMSWPHGKQWRKYLVDRLSEWPHGIDDLHDAPALPSYPLLQFIRNGVIQVLIGGSWPARKFVSLWLR